VELAGVDRHLDLLEVIRERRVAERMHADTDERAIVMHVPPKDLAYADLGRVLRGVFVADEPERTHRLRIVGRARSNLDRRVVRQVQRSRHLRFAHRDIRRKAMLPVERSRLERGDANVAVELRAPRLLVGLDKESKPPAVERVPGRRPLAAAPVRQVEGKPALCEVENQSGRSWIRTTDLRLIRAAL
jgi:hypothetical protein